ncbi:hypothetical protein [Streptomyces soliscabiei]|uniref:hypothetical protein n=1 Tax=Streptomyces soliscabiei TaxID=588897 RepID=UPI0029BD0626|nr:hypothetical protein [Streptomyces sp. NY05-11A]MDX2675062.1 hypothetical protein [Streptomyces sp. NY05-11A]
MTDTGPAAHPAPPSAPGHGPQSDSGRGLLFIPEEQTAALVDEELALEAARAAFTVTVEGVAFPSMAVHGSDPRNEFTHKPSTSATHAGVKIGTYWPDNLACGLPRHHSTLLLFDQSIGRIAAIACRLLPLPQRVGGGTASPAS